MLLSSGIGCVLMPGVVIGRRNRALEAARVKGDSRATDSACDFLRVRSSKVHDDAAQSFHAPLTPDYVLGALFSVCCDPAQRLPRRSS
jgi:hypothetical protein